MKASAEGARSEAKPSEVDKGLSVDYDGIIAALPMAAAFTLLLSRLLPIHFEYRPNDLGIVSWTTERQYPLQQETFWAIFAVATGGLLVWLLARVLRRSGAPVGSIVAVEALGAASLLVLLWFPLTFAAPVSILAAAGAVWHGETKRERPCQGRPPWSLRRPRSPGAPRPPPLSGGWGSGCWLWRSLRRSGVTLWNVAHSIPDQRRAIDHFSFYGELGQHLAWGNALLHGGLHGKDFFCLYGPLYDLGGVALWALLGRSIDAWELYVLANARPGADGAPAPGLRAAAAPDLGARDPVPRPVGHGATRHRSLRTSLPVLVAAQREAPLGPDRRRDRRRRPPLQPGIRDRALCHRRGGLRAPPRSPCGRGVRSRLRWNRHPGSGLLRRERRARADAARSGRLSGIHAGGVREAPVSGALLPSSTGLSLEHRGLVSADAAGLRHRRGLRGRAAVGPSDLAPGSAADRSPASRGWSPDCGATRGGRRSC